MASFVYILFSNAKDRYYVGQTDNIKNRMEYHNSGKSPYTSMASDWVVLHTEEYQTRTESRKRENQIKRKKSRKYIEWLKSASSRHPSG